LSLFDLPWIVRYPDHTIAETIRGVGQRAVPAARVKGVDRAGAKEARQESHPAPRV
jgi:hypothetical protein